MEGSATIGFVFKSSHPQKLTAFSRLHLPIPVRFCSKETTDRRRVCICFGAVPGHHIFQQLSGFAIVRFVANWCQLTQAINGASLRFWYELLVDIQRGRRAIMAQLRLGVLHLGTGHLQPFNQVPGRLQSV